MPEPNQNVPATVPDQPEAKPPLRKSMPVVIALVVIIGFIGIANLSSLLSGNRKNAPASAMPMRPAAPNAQQVDSFESQQQLQAQRDAEARQHEQELAAAMQQLQQTEGAPGPEAAGAPPMTPAQRDSIYGDSPNAPQRTSNMSEAQAEARQKELVREKERQDAIDSDTVAIDFEHTSPTTPPAATPEAAQGTAANAAGGAAQAKPVSTEAKANSKSNPMAGYDFDTYDGRLYRVFEGTVLEGVVTNHIDGGFSGPIMVSLTTDLYSHDHQQLLLPQGTRLLGDVQSVGNAQQRKMFVTFHRAICPDGFSLEFAKYTITSMSKETVQGSVMARGTALMALDRVYSPSHSREPRTEHWMLSITYYLNPKQVSDQAKIYPQYEFINPLGLTITEFHENRVSVDPIAPGAPAPTANGSVVPSAGGVR